MDLHGQSVRILSGRGTGTTVEFTLERAAAEAPIQSSAGIVTPLRGRRDQDVRCAL
jgi:hypothetical protein